MSASNKYTPEGYRSVTPSLSFKNTMKAIEFYKKALDAKALTVFPSPDGKSTMHATIQIGDSILMMGDEMKYKSAESLGSSPVSFFIYVPDSDASFKHAVDAGCKVGMPIEDQFWGDRCGLVIDPFGYSWMIASRKHELSHEEVRKNAEAFFANAGKQ